MPHLTDAAIKRALPQSKPRRLLDTRGLYLARPTMTLRMDRDRSGRTHVVAYPRQKNET